MRLPGFTADKSLYETSQYYKVASLQHIFTAVLPQQWKPFQRCVCSGIVAAWPGPPAAPCGPANVWTIARTSLLGRCLDTELVRSGTGFLRRALCGFSPCTKWIDWQCQPLDGEWFDWEYVNSSNPWCWWIP